MLIKNFVFFLIFTLQVLSAGPLLAATQSGPDLGALFEKLAAAVDTNSAEQLVDQIGAEWRAAKGATAEVILDRAAKAIAEENLKLGLDILDQLIALEPSFAEAWNYRARIHFLQDDFGGALSNIAVVLELEPKHFGALTGLSFILEELGEYEKAFEAINMVLELNPNDETALEFMERLESLALGQES